MTQDRACPWRIVIDLHTTEKLAKRIQRLVAAALPKRAIETVDDVERNCVRLERAEHEALDGFGRVVNPDETPADWQPPEAA
jgi:hypothetical protein